MSMCVKLTLCLQKQQKSTPPPSALNSVLNCFSRSLTVTRDSGSLLLAFLAAGTVNSAIVQSTCYKMFFNLNIVYAYASYMRTHKPYNHVGHTFFTARDTTNSISKYQFHEFRLLSAIAETQWLYAKVFSIQIFQYFIQIPPRESRECNEVAHAKYNLNDQSEQCCVALT